MSTDTNETPSSVFSRLFCEGFLRSLSNQCGSAWIAGVRSSEETSEGESFPFHAVIALEGSLLGDIHLLLSEEAALTLASALLGKADEALGDRERDAIVEFLDGALPDFCASSASELGDFTASLTVTSSPAPADLTTERFALNARDGSQLQLVVALDAALSSALEERASGPPATAEPAEASIDPALQASSLAATEDAEAAVSSANAPRPSVSAEAVNLNLVLEVELNVTLRFGQRQMTLREVLELASGSVIELDRQVEEPVELLLDGKVIARGEAVVIDGNYGLRVTEVPMQMSSAMISGV